MEQLNTQIKINDIRLQNNNLKFKSCGYLDIKYFGNEINNKTKCQTINGAFSDFE